MEFSSKIIMPAVFAGMVTLSACNNVKDRAAKYMENRPYSEYKTLIDESNATLIQSKLDSLAYRDIFMGTQAATDSSNLAEFSKIAAATRGYDDKHYARERETKIKHQLVEQGITVKELKSMEKSIGSYCNFDVVVYVSKYQHYADDWAYRKFFKKIGILDEKLNQKCDSISKIIRPK